MYGLIFGLAVFAFIFLIFLYSKVEKGFDDIPEMLVDYKRWWDMDNVHMRGIRRINHKLLEFELDQEESYEYLELERFLLEAQNDRIDAEYKFTRRYPQEDAVYVQKKLEDVKRKIENHPDRERIKAERLQKIRDRRNTGRGAESEDD